ncbi:MAG: alkaline phosphatase family protein, partial [Candidatus Aminicenantes bacterium]|nr:alkaline phosphatase family protein [Candidatus Aminicenantes bacterium]
IFFEKAITDGINVSESYLNHLIRSLEEKSELDLYLMRNKQWDLFSTVYSAVDTLQHYFWNYIDPTSIQYTKNSGIKKKIDEFFIKLDDILGKYCDELGSEGNLIVVSDHGFGPKDYIFYVNNFLLKNDYLSLESENLSRAKYKYILKKIMYKLDIFNLKRFVKIETRGKINRSLEPIAKIDWAHSKAGFRSNNEYGVYINRKGKYPGGIVEDEEYDSVMENLIKGFLNERNSFNGEKIFKQVLPGYSIYPGGKHSADAPDIMLIPERGVTLGGFNYSDLEVVLKENSGLLTGFHEPEGIF